MKVFHSYGTKERLFEMMKKVNNLNEALLPKEKKVEVIQDFVKYVGDYLKLGDNIPKITLSEDEKEAESMHSFGKFTPEIKDIRVVIVNRNLADILRTLAHELVHHKQFLDGKLTKDSNDTGSPDENEANVMAGILLRNYGKDNPIIFE